MKKLAQKLGRVDLELSKWTRNLLYNNLIEICEGLKEKNKLLKVLTSKNEKE